MLSLQAPVYTSACQGLVQRLPFGFVRLPEESCAACRSWEEVFVLQRAPGCLAGEGVEAVQCL